jgi:uncharacterized membrane protein
VKRFPFLDWTRGLAILIMIQCHAFNSFVRPELRNGGAYVLSQFIGGMAAPLFLFMAGITLAFRMGNLDGSEPLARRRWLAALRRAGYILLIAFAFRTTTWVGSLPRPDIREVFKVDILNCMAVALAAISVGAIFGSKGRTRFGVAAGLFIAAVSPIMANLPWEGAPWLLKAYLVPVPGTAQFSFFPCAAYAAFGLAAGATVKRTAPERFDRLMQWFALIGLPLVVAAQYFAAIPFSLYSHSNFWSDSPALVLIRTGISLALLPAAYLWTQYGARRRWSWMECIGRNALLVYWVHIALVYGYLANPVKRALTIPQSILATVLVVALMVGLSAGWLAWKRRRKRRAAPRAAEVSQAARAEAGRGPA